MYLSKELNPVFFLVFGPYRTLKDGFVQTNYYKFIKNKIKKTPVHIYNISMFSVLVKHLL